MLFDTGFYDEKWSVWDTFGGFARNLRTYVVVAAYRIANVVTTQNRRANAVTTQNRRSKVISTGG